MSASIPAVTASAQPTYVVTSSQRLGAYSGAFLDIRFAAKFASLIGSIGSYLKYLEMQASPLCQELCKKASLFSKNFGPVGLFINTFSLVKALHASSGKNASTKEAVEVLNAGCEVTRDVIKTALDVAAATTATVVATAGYAQAVIAAVFLDSIHECICVGKAVRDLCKAKALKNSLEGATHLVQKVNPNTAQSQEETKNLFGIVKSVAAIAGSALKVVGMFYGFSWLLIAGLVISTTSKLSGLLKVVWLKTSDVACYEAAIAKNLTNRAELSKYIALAQVPRGAAQAPDKGQGSVAA
ncbi:MAG: hypothetical protein AAGI90_04005 [Chlamydiota bacterium]